MVLVAYYSRKGHVRAIAEDYAKRHNCQLLEIRDTINRKGILGFINAGRQSRKKIATPIEPIKIDVSSFEKVVVCTPVWAGGCACSIRTFLRDFGSQIKELDYIIVSGGKAAHQSIIDDMDATAGKKHGSAITLSRGESLN